MTPEEILAALKLSESLVREEMRRVKYGSVMVEYIIQDGKFIMAEVTGRKQVKPE